MPTVHHNKSAKVRERLRVGGLSKNNKLSPILDDIYKRLHLKLSVDGIQAQEIEGGFHLKVDPSLFGLGQFIVRQSGGYVTVSAGTFHGLIPTMGGVSLAAATPPKMQIATHGTVYVYIKINCTLGTTHSFVSSYTFTSCTIHSAAAVPSDAGATATFYRVIATIEDGIVTAQTITASFDGFVEDDGNAASTGVLTTT